MACLVFAGLSLQAQQAYFQQEVNVTMRGSTQRHGPTPYRPFRKLSTSIIRLQSLALFIFIYGQTPIKITKPLWQSNS
jgi:hypothetical protein